MFWKKVILKMEIAFLMVFFLGNSAVSQEKFSSLVGNVSVKPVAGTTQLQVPFITWGGDMATFYANGGLQTKSGTIFQKQGLDLKLVPGDDFVQQVKDYCSGKSPFLRGTFRMMGMPCGMETNWSAERVVRSFSICLFSALPPICIL